MSKTKGLISMFIGTKNLAIPTALFCILLGGCQTTANPPADSKQEIKVNDPAPVNQVSQSRTQVLSIPKEASLYGRGDLVISEHIEGLFRNEYLKFTHPGFLILPTTGRSGTALSCRAGDGACRADARFIRSLEECEKEAKTKCYIFAKGSKVVWQGQIRMRKWTGEVVDLPYLSPPVARKGDEISLSPPINQMYREAYLADPRAGSFIVSDQGNWASWNQCKTLEGACKPDKEERVILDECQASSGKKCHIIAKRHKIVWRGSVIFRFENGVKLTRDRLPDRYVCAQAMEHDKNATDWSDKTRVQFFVAEAKNRGYKPGICASLVGIKPHYPTDQQICNKAMRGNGKWSTSAKDRVAVSDATIRGFTPETCFDAVFGS